MSFSREHQRLILAVSDASEEPYASDSIGFLHVQVVDTFEKLCIATVLVERAQKCVRPTALAPSFSDANHPDRLWRPYVWKGTCQSARVQVLQSTLILCKKIGI